MIWKENYCSWMKQFRGTHFRCVMDLLLNLTRLSTLGQGMIYSICEWYQRIVCKSYIRIWIMMYIFYEHLTLFSQPGTQRSVWFQPNDFLIIWFLCLKEQWRFMTYRYHFITTKTTTRIFIFHQITGIMEIHYTKLNVMQCQWL